MKRLQDKVAIIYGNGNIGAATAIAFAREGAKVYVAGKTSAKLDAIASRIKAEEGDIEISIVDALDEKSIADHMTDVIKKTGRVDISFNTIGLPMTGIQGTALRDLSLEKFMLPITTYVQSHFLTSKIAAREMVPHGGGVILMHTPNASRISAPFVGGMIPAWAAMEGLCRSLSVEYAQQGVRSVCLHSTGIPETSLIDEVWSIHGKAHGLSFEQFHQVMEGATHRKKLTTLAEFTGAAVFVASDEGSGISGTIFNLTSGIVVH